MCIRDSRLALEEFGSKAHTYSPAYTEQDFPEIMRCSSHITVSYTHLDVYKRQLFDFASKLSLSDRFDFDGGKLIK